MTKAFTPPKNLAQCADQYYSTREQRLALERQAEELKTQEGVLKEYIIDNLPKSNATGIAGKLVRVSVVDKTVYQVKDWDSIREYIVKNQKKTPGVWALMNKALNQKTVKEMADAGTTVPGVEHFEAPTLSVNKL